MKQFKFWFPVVNESGTTEPREFVFTAAGWTQARKMMSDAVKQVRAE